LLEVDQLARNPFSDSFKVRSTAYSEVEQYGKNTKDKLKLDGDKSVGRKDYLAFVHQSSMAREGEQSRGTSLQPALGK